MNRQAKIVLVDDDAIVMTARMVVNKMNEHGWTQAQMAEYVGLSASAVGSLLRRNGYRSTANWRQDEVPMETPFGDAV